MADTDRSVVAQLTPVTARQKTDGCNSDPAELVLNVPPDSLRAAKSGKSRTRKTRVRPHLWPQPSTVSPKRMRCLCCGVSFWERRAERSCQPRK